ncbi:MAG: DinB family protein [Actinomycetota bacterium]|nr:DinB family protein [Actinomycetota bacterium]
METANLLLDAFGRIRDLTHDVVDGLGPGQLTARVDDRANTIAWLVWHLSRVQDDHIAEVAQVEQAWTTGSWVEQFGLPFEPSATGYGHSADDVAAVRVESGELLSGYHDAVHQNTVKYLQHLSGDDLDRIVDASWEPPVTLGMRLVSVISDDLQHLGQAAFLRGLLERMAD